MNEKPVTVRRKKDEAQPTCATCRFFVDQTESTDQVKWGVCRRFPKQWYHDGEDSVCDHAQQDPADWCGEWKAKQ
jgi:hypothetical protein